MKRKKAHYQNSSNRQIVEREKMDTMTQIHDWSVSWLGTGTSITHDWSVFWLGTGTSITHDWSVFWLGTGTSITHGGASFMGPNLPY